MASLADALPKAPYKDDDETLEEARAKQRNFKSRPGALKRKAKMESLERERFGKNLALIAGSCTKAGSGSDQKPSNPGNTSSRWAAIHNHIQAAVLSQRGTLHARFPRGLFEPSLSENHVIASQRVFRLAHSQYRFYENLSSFPVNASQASRLPQKKKRSVPFSSRNDEYLSQFGNS